MKTFSIPQRTNCQSQSEKKNSHGLWPSPGVRAYVGARALAVWARRGVGVCVAMFSQVWFRTWRRAFERVSLPVMWALGDALKLPIEDLAGAVRVLRAPEACTVRRMCGGAAPDYHGYFARVKVELLASADRGCGTP